MAIHKPGKVLLKQIPLKFVQKKVGGGGKKAVDSEIPLVPFIDFLVTLVVFLLTSFSASGELLAQQPNLKMPDAKHVVDLEIQPVIAINPDVVTLDGRRIADTRTLGADARVERIEQMIEWSRNLTGRERETLREAVVELRRIAHRPLVSTAGG
jgi:hypothetical protein